MKEKEKTQTQLLLDLSFLVRVTGVEPAAS